jgi:glycine/D-amino acid oxidase-like deaminating enzyme
MERWPDEISTLVTMGCENLDAIEYKIKPCKKDCDFQHGGELVVATEAYQLDDLKSPAGGAGKFGYALEYLDGEITRALVNSPTYLGDLVDPNVVLVDPARLAWGLRCACLKNSFHLYECTVATGLKNKSR